MNGSRGIIGGGRRLVVVGVLLWASWASAGIIYVDAGREDDSGDGLTSATAKRTIQAGVDTAAAGDRVVIGPGFYTGVGNYNIDCGQKSIVVTSTDPNDAAVVMGTVIDPNLEGGAFWLQSTESSETRICGLAITRATSAIEGMGGAVFCRCESSAVIEKCVFSRCEAAVYCESGQRLEVRDCTIENCRGYDWHDGVICAVWGSLLVENCVVRQNVCGAVCCWFGAAEIKDCVISDNQDPFSGTAAIQCGQSTVAVSNSIIIRNAGSAICAPSGDVTATCCTIAYNGRPPEGQLSLRNSVLWDKGMMIWGYELLDIKNCNVKGIEGTDGNISVEPMLTYDGHLQAGSPCIDAIDANGPNIGALSARDIDGERRLMGGRLDMGADEFIDDDGDGMADWYEEKYFGSTAGIEAEEDTDEGGHSNLDEYRYYSSDPTVAARRYYVDASIGSDEGDGLSWGTAKRTIQAAADAAGAGDYVVVSEGTYSGEGNRDVDPKGKSLVIQSKEPLNREVVDRTIINPEGKGSAFFIHSGEGKGCRISGFTVHRGSGPPSGYFYGAIYCEGSSPIIKHCVLGEIGGGIFCGNSSAAIEKCVFEPTAGRTVYIYNEKGVTTFPVVTDCDITGGYDSIKYGYVTDYGVYCEGANVRISRCRIKSTRVAGICCAGGKVEIDNSMITGHKGCGIGTLNVEEVWSEKEVTVVNSVIVGQRRGYVKEGSGVGIYGSTGTLRVENCIIGDNEVGDIVWGGDSIVRYSNVERGYAGYGNISCDPCFVSPGHWEADGARVSWFDFWVDGDYRLWIDSACIDAGDPCYVWDGNEVDLAGRSRVFNGRVDMGAYEFWMLEAEVRVAPGVLVRKANGPKKVLAVVYLGEQCEAGEFDVGEGLTLYPGGVGSVRCSVVERPGGRYKGVSIAASFARDEVLEGVSENGDIEIEIAGHLNTGEWFSGTDVLRVQ